MNCTYGLRVMVQLPVLDMKLSGPHHPLVRHLHFVREIDAREEKLGGGGVVSHKKGQLKVTLPLSHLYTVLFSNKYRDFC